MKVYSVSKLNEWNQCQLKYFAHHIEREHWEKTQETSLQLVLGELVHSYFERFYARAENMLEFKKGLVTLARWKDAFRDDWQLQIQAVPVFMQTDADLQLEKGIMCLENFYQREKARDFKMPVFIEKSFSIKLGDLFRISGKIDRIDEEADGSLTVIDYKISNSIKTAGQAHYDYQLATYAFACEQDLLHKWPSRVGWYYPIQGREIFAEPSIQAQEDLLSAFMEIDSSLSVRGNQKELYPASPSTGFCDYCGYQKKCPQMSCEEVGEADFEEESIARLIEEATELNERLKADEKRLSEMKEKIKHYLLENNLSKFQNVHLQRQDRGNYLVQPVWDILRKLDNGYDFVEIRKSALKENIQAFTL